MSDIRFLTTLQDIIEERLTSAPDGSYTAKLARQGVRKVAQKLGEEGVEVALAGVSEDAERVTAEAADLLYHLIVLLRLRELKLEDVVAELERRHSAPSR